MIRRFLIADGDNNPVTTRISITPTTSSGTEVISFAYPVSWAIISGIGDSAAGTTEGPIYFDPDGSTSYSIRDLAGVDALEQYVVGSLQVFLNGQALDNSITFTENANQYEFNLVVGAGALSTAPIASTTEGTLFFTGLSGTPAVGDTVTGGTSLSTALVVDVTTSGSTGQIKIKNMSGPFTAGEPLSMSPSTATATAAVSDHFIQGGDRLSVVYRPVIVAASDGLEAYISKIYPDIAQGLEITYNNATPSEQFSIDLVYR